MSRFFNGLESFGRFLGECAAASVEAEQAAVELSAEMLLKRSQKMFGDEQQLAPISQDSTAQLRSDGGAGGPLLIDGTLLRGSVGKHVGPGWAEVGSAEPIMLYHEKGYTTSPESMIPDKIVPPRPVFHITAFESEEDLEAIAQGAARATFGLADSGAGAIIDKLDAEL